MAHHNISTACILEYKQTILMIKEEQNGVINWDIPAGSLDQGETVLDGVIREVFEETGITITNPELISVFQCFQNDQSGFSYLFYTKITDEQFSQIKITEKEILEIKWFSFKEIQDLIDSGKTEHNLAKQRLLKVFNIKEILNQPQIIHN
jgi:8-oxo-dGTP pyrophosphatase MutT (NUDIX family)